MMLCLQESFNTKLIDSLNWPEDLDLLTFRSDSCKITKATINDEFDAQHKNKERSYRKVKVQTLDLEFFFQD